MGALPNYRQAEPDRPKTPPPQKADKPTRGKAKDCKPRTYQELDRAFRAGSSYEKVTGWTPLFHDFIGDLRRLSSGKVCTDLLLYLLSDLGRQREKRGEALPTETRPVTISDIATLLEVNERSINRELQYLQARKMALVARLEGGKAVVTLLFSAWTALEQSYKQWADVQRAEIHEVTPEDENPEENAPPAVKAGTVILTKAPVVVKGGHRSRSLPIDVGVRATRIAWDSPGVDCSFSAVIESGELVWRGKLVSQKTLESKKDAKSVESSTSPRSSGHIRPEITANPPQMRVSGSPQVSHPRAEELAKLFDPLILRSCGKSLSEDGAALQAACELVGDTDHDFLVKQAMDRAERTLKPRHVVALCREIAANWKKLENLPPSVREGQKSKPLPTKEEIDEMIRLERIELAAKRKAMRGRK